MGPGIRQRKIIGCYRTIEGAENRDVIMSVIGTKRLQGKDLLTDGKEHVPKTPA